MQLCARQFAPFGSRCAAQDAEAGRPFSSGTTHNIVMVCVRRLCCRRPAVCCMAQLDVDHRRAAAVLAVDKYVKSGATVGLGSGELVNLTIAEIGLRIAKGSLEGITAVPSCNAAASEAAFNGIPMTTLEKAGKVCLL